MNIVQSVLNNLKKIYPFIRIYVLNLMLSSGRKNCAAMAFSTGTPEKQLYDFLSEPEIHIQLIKQNLLELAQTTREENILRALVIDPTAIIKHYARIIENLSYDRTGCTKKVEKTLVPIYVAVIDKNVTIPLFMDWWVQKKIIGEAKYKSKVQIAQDLIVNAQQKKVKFNFIALDGAFSVSNMFAFFTKNLNLKFIMRISKSRKITTDDGVIAQLKDHPALKLIRNNREKTIQATLNKNGIRYWFTAEKRKSRDGDWETVFLISNMDLSAKEQVAAYALRTPIEQMIRTTKQKFGATQCQATSALKQEAHIMAGFLSYAIINSKKNNKQKKSVDAIVNEFRNVHFYELMGLMQNKKQLLHAQNNLPINRCFQNQGQYLFQCIDKFDIFST